MIRKQITVRDGLYYSFIKQLPHCVVNENLPRAPTRLETSETSLDQEKTLTTIVYVLQTVSLFMGIPMFVAVIVNYVTRSRVSGTWLDTHYSWQIRTFWYSLVWTVLGALTMILLIGYLILGIAYLWLIYRIVRGWLNLASNRPMY